MKKLVLIGIIALVVMILTFTGCQNIADNGTNIVTTSHPTSKGMYDERVWFYPTTSDIRGLQGDAQPNTVTWASGNTFDFITETEIYLNGNYDCVEYVDRFGYDSNGNHSRKVGWCVYDNSFSSSVRYQVATVGDKDDISWIFDLNPTTHVWSMTLYDNTTHTTVGAYTYTEGSASYSSYVHHITGSSELNLNNYNSFYVKNTICNTSVKRGSTWYNAGSYFNWSSTDPNKSYVRTTYSKGSYIYTYHEASNNSGL